MPKFSLILPVRNGGNYIRECVDSILRQSLPDFELLVLENASTDNTPAWLESLSDPRIRVFPSERPLDIVENWKRISLLPKSAFMTMIGHDDVLDHNYLSVMDQLIATHPKASLYQAHFRYIDSKGKEFRKCRPMDEIMQPPAVLKNFITGQMDIMGTGFMMRSSDFDSVKGMPAYPNLLFSDMELFIELARKSYLAVAKQECFSYRSHPGATTSVSTDAKVLNAFDQFVSYLENLKDGDPSLADTIRKHSGVLLAQYCQGITHKVLRTPKRKRQTPSVGRIINRFRQYGRRLTDSADFEPLNVFAVRMGRWIDSNWVTRSLFLLFKKLFPKPVL